jgi:hypothetical protein
MDILQRFSRSLYDLKWLSQRRRDGGLAAAHFFFLAFIVSTIFGIWLSFQLIGLWNDSRKFFKDQIPNFQAQMRQGSLSVTGLERPYVKEGEWFRLVIDTATSGVADIKSLAAGNEDKAIMLVTAGDLSVYQPDRSKIETTMFKDLPDFSTDKAAIVAKVEGMGWLSFVIVFLVLFLSYGIFVVTQALFLLFWSLIVWVFSLIAKKSWKYKEILTVGAFAMTAAVLLNCLLLLSSFNPPFLSAFVFLVYMFSIVFAPNVAQEEKKDKK